MKSNCQHENFAVMATIDRLTNEAGDKVISFVGKFAVHCIECGQPFEFFSLGEATRSLDREQLSISLKPSTGIRTQFRTRVHVADKPQDGTQKCFRCDAILAESGGEWHSPENQGTSPRSLFWSVGSFVGILERADGDPCNPRSFMLMDRDAKEADEIRCCE